MTDSDHLEARGPRSNLRRSVQHGQGHSAHPHPQHDAIGSGFTCYLLHGRILVRPVGRVTSPAGEDEVTPTMKLRRKIVAEHFADEIEALYAQ